MASLRPSTIKTGRRSTRPFQMDSQGRAVFFPWGQLGKGYIVTSLARRKLISIIVSLYGWGFLLTLLIARVLTNSHNGIGGVLGLGSLLAIAVTYPMAVGFLVAGLPVSNMEYRMPKRSRPAVFSLSGLWMLFTACALAAGGFIAMVVFGWGMIPVAGLSVIAAILVVFCAFLFWRIRIKDKEQPPKPPRANFLKARRKPVEDATFAGRKPVPAYWTWGLIAFLVLVFAVENLVAYDRVTKSLLTPGLGSLVALGGASRDLVVLRGEWWRLLTAVLLHASLIHILFNLFALWIAGMVLEHLLGPRLFLSLFFFCGLCGSLCSITVNPPSQVGVGASGAIMGLMAAGMVMTFKMPVGPQRNRLQIYLAQVLVYNVAPVFIASNLGQGTDYGAHLGGALAGAGAGFFLFHEWDPQSHLDRWEGLGKGVAYGGFFLYLAAMGCAALTFDDSRQWFSANQYTERASLYSALLEKDPNNAKIFYARATCYYRQNNPEGYRKAIEDYTSAIKFSKDYFDAYFYRGCAYRHVGKYGESIADLDQCARIKPENEYTYLNRGLAYEAEKKHKEALADYGHILQINPKNAYAYLDRGVVYYGFRNYKKAMADYNQALSLEPNYVGAYYNRGTVYLNQGNLKAALADFNKALELNGHYADAYKERSEVYQKMGQKAQADADLKMYDQYKGSQGN